MQCISTAFVFFCDVKHSDTLQGSSHVCCYLFLGGCGQKWAWPFRSWNSEIYCISREWIDKKLNFFPVDTNLGKLVFNLIIIGWAWSKMGKTFRSYGTLKPGASHDFTNQADWFNKFWFDHQSSLYHWHLLGLHCSCTC